MNPSTPSIKIRKISHVENIFKLHPNDPLFKMKLIQSLSFFFIVTTTCINPLVGQERTERFEAVDVQSYCFELDLNDSTDIIRGRALVELLFKKGVDSFSLDLKCRSSHGTGMVVTGVLEDGKEADFVHRDDRLIIAVQDAKQGALHNFQIDYEGVPGDGLIISQNKFGDRTFFGDNWPDRAHHWLPVVDHPSDKALAEFVVHAPGHYKIVSIGTRIGESREDGRINSNWKCEVPLSTKMMVIGVSPFAVQDLKSASGIPVSSWVYPQNRDEGFHDYSIAIRPLDFFESYIAPYPFSKLANVQSKTVFGGMENASCIFYSESTVTGKRVPETLFAHEIAHQWYGDALSELDWHHVWISEGFATYLADLYLEQVHGRGVFVASLEDERDQVMRFSRRRLAPIVDTTLDVSIRLLNANSYDKAGWVLHMLRRELGDDLFRECLRTFYEEFKYSNALTGDFQRVVESLSGRDFELFFRQWFFEPGHPVLSHEWKYRAKKINFTIVQHQSQCVFEFPLEIEFRDGKGHSFRETVAINAPRQEFTIYSDFKPAEIILDPDTWLLYESRK